MKPDTLTPLSSLLVSLMVRKGSEGGTLPMLKSTTIVGAPTPKPPKTSWKTQEQEDWMATLMPDFLTHQSNGSLERFWPRVYEAWYKQWPIVPTPEEIENYESPEGAILVLRVAKNKVRIPAHLSTVP